MKKISLLLFFATCCAGFAQNKQLLYGFPEIPQSLLLNPGTQVENDWYVGIPFMSHVHASFGMTGITVYDIFADDGKDFNNKLENAIYAMNDTDYFVLNQQYDLFSGGFAFGSSFKKDKYLSFGMYQEANAFIYFPKDYAILAYEGNQNNLNRIFDLSDLNMSAELLTVFHLGFNKKVNSKFTYGVRGKIYSSVFDIKSINNRGSFVTKEGEDNYLKHDFNLDLEVQTAGIKSFLDDENSDVGKDMKKLIGSALFGGNLGVGIDVGFTYKLTDQWILDASLQDIGFISYKKDIENFNLDGNLTYEGINPLFQESGEGQSAEEYWDELATDFEDLFEVDTTYSKYTTARPIKLNAALQYAFGKKNNQDCNCLQANEEYQNRVGAHLFLMKRPKKPQAALTAFYYRRLFTGLGVKASYTLDAFSYSNLGFALSANISNINFYIAADNLLKYQNLAKAQSVSLQLGFNYIFKNNED